MNGVVLFILSVAVIIMVVFVLVSIRKMVNLLSDISYKLGPDKRKEAIGEIRGFMKAK
jgi:hypothetical protein